MACKYVFVTGGVVSGLGKGITAASLGRLLKARGLKVAMQKFDPYLNVDPGTMSPFQHGEVFVTDDGAETDLDLGHYERFIDENLSVYSSITAGKVYWTVLNKERNGEYLGGTIQVIPHITNEIKERIYCLGKLNSTDVVISEIGGTVGDIESLPFLEAIRQIMTEVGRENCLYIHVTLIAHIPGSNELKSKPTQHSVKELLSIGIQPDILVCRSESKLDLGMKEKIAMFCNVEKDCVIENLSVDILYEAPLMLEENGLGRGVCRKLNLPDKTPDLCEWINMVNRAKQCKGSVKIALVGKYIKLHDSYLSVVEALKHGGIENDTNIEIKWVSSEDINKTNAGEYLSDCDGVLVPGGFGDRGIEGKIAAIKYAREANKPFFGICLGMQMAVIEITRDLLGFEDANSSEFNPQTKHPVVDLMPEQKKITAKGGTMRLGLYPCAIADNTFMQKAYEEKLIKERHRHRYEFNNEYTKQLIDAGLIISGKSPDGNLVEAVEFKGHRWFVGVQFHPEFRSRPNRAHPLFREFIGAALKLKKETEG